jgi:hypothetical protein
MHSAVWTFPSDRMTDLDRALDTVKRRDWEKMRASWLDRVALTEDLSSEEIIPTSDVQGVAELFEEFAQERREAEKVYAADLEKFDLQQLRVKERDRRFDPSKAAADRRRHENNQARLRSQNCPARRCEVPGIAEPFFREALRLAHKGFHVLGCAEKGADGGMRSWSLCTAYQGGFFASKAILALCGIGTIEVNGKTLLFDIFPGPVSQSSEYADINFNYISYRLDHKDIWQALQRVLGVTVCDLWPNAAVDKLKAVEEKLFARQRNHIHYRSLYWPFPDLYDFLTAGPFGTIGAWDNSSEDLDFERGDISLVLAFYLVKMALTLVKDIGTISKKLNTEITLFQKSATAQRHPLYHDMLLTA